MSDQQLMDSKQRKLRPPTDEELKEMFHGIIQENRDHGHIPPRSPKCNDCVNRICGTSKCSLLYPHGIPKEIITEKIICEKFEQKHFCVEHEGKDYD